MSIIQSSPPEQVQSPDDFLSRPDFAQVLRQVRPAPSRYRNEIGKFTIHRASTCANCGHCVEICPEGVHRMPEGYRQVIRPLDYRCIGAEGFKTDPFFVSGCSNGALSLFSNPTLQ